MKKINRKLRQDFYRAVAMLLIVCMLPFSAFPGKVTGQTVNAEEIPQEVAQTQQTDAQESSRAAQYLDASISANSIGDMTVSGNWILEEDTVVDELVFHEGTIELNGYTLTVCKDFIHEGGQLIMYDESKLIVRGDYRLQTRAWNEETGEYVYGDSQGEWRTSYELYVLIAGDFYVYSDIIGDYSFLGTLELKGNLYQEPSEIENTYNKGSIHCNESHELILSGDKKQMIQWPGDHTKNQIGKLTIRNDSEEGIVFEDAPLVYREIDMKKGQHIIGTVRVGGGMTFTNGYYGGDIEVDRSCIYMYWSDVEIEGNVILEGVVQIEGDVTVNKDFIVKDRNYYSNIPYLYINDGANFVVKGNLDASQATTKWGFRGNNTGIIHIDGDVIGGIVDLDFEQNSRLEIGGNLDLSKSYYIDMSDTATLAFCGNKKQEVIISDRNRTWFNNVEIQNESEDGVVFERDDINIASLKPNGNHVSFQGKEVLEAHTLTEDKIITGDYVLYGGTMDLNGHSLTYNGDLELISTTLDINGGSFHINGDLRAGYRGYIMMDQAEDLLLVEGDLDIDSQYYSYSSANTYQNRLLTSGELIVHGNFTAYSGFCTNEEHVTSIYRKNYNDDTVQNITLNNEEQVETFATLKLSSDREKHYVCDTDLSTVAKTYETFWYDEERPATVTGLKTKEIGINDITIAFDKADENSGVDRYEIYRDGKKIAEIQDNSYQDTGLKTETEYTYEVFAVDTDGVRANKSPKLTVKTKADTEEPDRVEDVKTEKRTGSSITLKWNATKDNCGVTGYNVYRDNVLIAENINALRYKDSGLTGNTLYKYHVTALDARGNESEKSEFHEEATFMPQIIGVTPADYKEIGGEKQYLQVKYAKCENGVIADVKIEYCDTNENWVTIADDLSAHNYVEENGEEKLSYYFSYCYWDLSTITGQNDIRVRYTIYDEDSNKDCVECTYRVDREGPAIVTDFEVMQENGVPTFTWVPLSDVVCSGYHLYRRIQGENRYAQIADLNGNMIQTYSDVTCDEGVTYEYMMRAYDDFGQESEDSDVLKITIGHDAEMPFLTLMKPAGETVLSAQTTITLSGCDNKKVHSAKIVIEKEQKIVGQYTSEDFFTVDGSCYLSWDTRNYPDGEYTVKAYYYDKAGNESNCLERTYIIDNTGPSKVVFDKCEIQSLQGYLSWKNVPEEDVAHFVVEKLSNNGWERYHVINDKLYCTISNLQPETTYSFRVCAYDMYGNKGVYSDVWSFTTGKDSTNPKITLIGPAEEVQGNVVYLVMNAEDDVEMAYGLFSYSTDGDTYTQIAKVNGQGRNSVYRCTWNTAEIPEGNVTVKFEAYDKSGNKNFLPDEEEVLYTYRLDHTAPFTPTDFTCESLKGAAEISWKAEEKDIDYFYISRAISEKGNYRYIGDTTSLSFIDEKVEENTTYYYKVIAVDKAGNMSESTNPLKVHIKSDDEPPQMVALSPKDGQIYGGLTDLKAVATDNANLSKIIFEYKEAETENWTIIAEVPVVGAQGYASKKWDASKLKEDTMYCVRAKAVDKSGNESAYLEKSCRFDLTAPDSISATIHKEENALKLTYTQNEETDFAYYEIYRRAYETETEFSCIGKTENTYYTDETVSAGKLYVYKVYATDMCGNKSEAAQVSGYAESDDKTAPHADLAESIVATEGQYVSFDGLTSSDNVRITKYTWDFGDGSTSTQACPLHVYNDAGTYCVKLTVEDANGNCDTAESKVVVAEESETVGSVEVCVVTTDGQAIPGANMYVHELGMTLKTATNGKINLVAEAGTYNVTISSDTHRAKAESIQLQAGKNEEVQMMLYSQTATIGSMTPKRMTFQEIQAAGIDLSEPDNYFMYESEVVLFFEGRNHPQVLISYYTDIPAGNEQSVSVTDCYTKSSGGSNDTPPVPIGKTYSSGPRRAIVLPANVQKVEWLKNMYEISLDIINVSDGDVGLTDVKGSINLPDGLSLATLTSGEQKKEKYIGGLASGQSGNVSWYVRGDKTGEYDVTSEVTGTFADTGELFGDPYSCKLTVNKQQSKGLHLYIMPESKGYFGEKYYVQYKLVNESGETFYQVKTNFGATRTANRELIIEVVKDGAVTETKRVDSGVSYYLPDVTNASHIPTLGGGDQVVVGEFKPGDCITGTYVIAFPHDSKNQYYQLIDSFVRETQSSNAEITVSVLPIASHLDKWQIVIDDTLDETSESNHTNGAQTTSPSEDTEDPINMMTGAFYTSQSLMTVAGVRNLLFDVNYNSTQTVEKGMLGYGWYHTYESYVRDENGLLKLYLTPQSSIAFLKESAKENKVRGAFNDGTVTVLPDDEVQECYVPLYDYYKDYHLEKTESGYRAFLPDGKVNEYDADGNMTRTTNLQGQSITFEHSDTEYSISDSATGKSIKAQMDDTGKITKLTDPAGNTVWFTYDAQENLVSIKNKRGYTVRYAYENHKITQAWDAQDKLYLVNTYDENGRVLTQDDGREDTPLATLTYAEDEETGNLSVSVKGRNGAAQQVLANAQGKGLQYTDSIGGVKTYTYNEEGDMISATFPDGRGETYCYDESGNLTVICDSATGTREYTYDENRQITGYQTSAGNVADYVYNEKNLMIKEVADGVTKTYTYNEHGQKLTENVEGKGTISYSYDSNGNMTSITYPDGSKDTFTYDAIGNVIGYTNRNGVITEYEIDPNGHVLSESVLLKDGTKAVTSYTYDAYGNKLSQTDANGNKTSYAYDAEGNCVKETRADGSIITYTYDTNGNITSVTYPDGVTTQTAVYDTAGNLAQVVDTLKQTTIGQYSKASQLVKTVQADGGVVTYDYYENGLLKSQTDAEGNMTSYTYDEAGRVLTVTNGIGTVTSVAYDSRGNMQSVTDGEGNTVTLTYNAFGEVTKTTDANGNQTTYAYDSMGNCISTTDALGNVTCYGYDAMGQIISVTKEGRNGDSITLSYVYDNLGNITSVTDGEGSTYRISYDKAGNVTAIYDAYGVLAESYTYDSVYNLTSVTDGNGAKTTYTYDSMGNKIKTLNESNGSVTTYSYIGGNLISAATDALGGKTSATYDSMGNLASFTNPNGGVTTYTYDKNQNVTSECVGDYYKVTYTYDGAGNVKTMTNSRGQVTTYEYDKAGRVTKQTDEAGTISYTYDAGGNKLSVTEIPEGSISGNTITRTYDALNRVKSYCDGNGKEITYEYDAFGNVASMTYPGGHKVTYTYDKNGNVLTVTDRQNRVTKYSYDKNGRLIKTERPDGSTESRTYDKAGQLLTIKDVTKAGTVISDYTYTYDLSGNITAISDKSAGTTEGQSTDEETVQMEYDDVNRLIKYNGKQVKYDADGNMIYGPLDGEMATFAYDCRNRLIKVTTDSGETTEYSYDTENIRTKVIKHAGTAQECVTTYVTDTASDELSRVLEAETVDKSGKTETILYTYGNGLIAQESVEMDEIEEEIMQEYLIYHFNNIGSTTAVTDESGAIKRTYTYSIYGKLLSGNYGEIVFLYNGQYGVMSDDNGLYYMRSRYYNIDIKRFINQDILTGSIDSSQSLNRYAYVEGNPVSYLDPFGLDEYKVDTSTAHTLFGLTGAAAFIVGGVATVFFPGAVVVIAGAYVVGAISSGLNAGLYINDAIEADTDEERYSNIANFGWNLMTIGTGGLTAVTQLGAADSISKIVDAVVNAISANWGQWDDL